MKPNKTYLLFALVGLLVSGTMTQVVYAQHEHTTYNAKENIDKKEEQKDKKENDLNIYGVGSMEAAFNLLNYPDKTNFTPSLIIMKKKEKGLSSDFAFDIGGKIGVKKNIIIEGETLTFVAELKATRKESKLGQLYASYKNLSFGLKPTNFLTTSTFPAPKVIHWVGYKQDIGENWILALSIEDAPICALFPQSINQKTKTSIFKSRTEQIAVSSFLQYKLKDDFGVIELSTLMRPLGFYNETKHESEYLFGYGVNLATNLNLNSKTDILTLHALLVDGVGNYINDLSSLELEKNAVYINPVDSKINTLMAIEAHGSHEHRWDNGMRVTLSAGITKMIDKNKDADKRKDDYDLGSYGTLNVAYYWTEQLYMCTEGSWGLRLNLDSNQNSKHAGHVKVATGFNF